MALSLAQWVYQETSSLVLLWTSGQADSTAAVTLPASGILFNLKAQSNSMDQSMRVNL